MMKRRALLQYSALAFTLQSYTNAFSQENEFPFSHFSMDENKSIIYKDNPYTNDEILLLNSLVPGRNQFVYDENCFVHFPKNESVKDEKIILFIKKNEDIFYTDYYFTLFNKDKKSLESLAKIDYNTWDKKYGKQLLDPLDRFVGILSETNSEFDFIICFRNYNNNILKFIAYNSKQNEFEILFESNEIISKDSVVAIVHSDAFPWSAHTLIIQNFGLVQSYYSIQFENNFQLTNVLNMNHKQIIENDWLLQFENDVDERNPTPWDMVLADIKFQDNSAGVLFHTTDKKLKCAKFIKTNNDHYEMKYVGSSDFKLDPNNWVFYSKLNCENTSQEVLFCQDKLGFFIIAFENLQNEKINMIKKYISCAEVLNHSLFVPFFQFENHSKKIGFQGIFYKKDENKIKNKLLKSDSENQFEFPFLLKLETEETQELGIYKIILEQGQYKFIFKNSDSVQLVSKQKSELKMNENDSSAFNQFSWMDILGGFIEGQTSFFHETGLFSRCVYNNDPSVNTSVSLSTNYNSYYMVHLFSKKDGFFYRNMNPVISSYELDLYLFLAYPKYIGQKPIGIHATRIKKQVFDYGALHDWARAHSLLNVVEVDFEIEHEVASKVYFYQFGSNVHEYIDSWKVLKLKENFAQEMLTDAMNGVHPDKAALKYIKYDKKIIEESLNIVEEEFERTFVQKYNLTQLDFLRRNMISEIVLHNYEMAEYREKCDTLVRTLGESENLFNQFHNAIKRILL